MKHLVVVSVTSAALALLAAGCCEPGSGVVVQESRSVPSFRRLALDVPGIVHVSQGPSTPLKIRTDDNLIDDVVTRVRGDGDTLVIETRDDTCCIDPTELVVQVSSEDMEGVVIEGSGDLALRGTFEADEISLAIDGSGSITAERLVADEVALEIDGSGDMDLVVDAGLIRSSVDGSGNYRLAGSAAEHAISIEGSADVDAARLETGTTRIEIDGSGDCTVAADELLDVSIEGSGEVAYCGQPRISEDIDGSGGVERASSARCN